MEQQKLVGAFGIFVILGLAFLLSNNRRKVNLRLVFTGLALQISFAMIILWSAPGRKFFDAARYGVAKFLSFANEGSMFVFGQNFRDHFFAFSVLPTIIFVSTITAVLFYLGVLQFIIKVMAKTMVFLMNVSGVEALCCASNVFIGQTEAPLLIKPYLKTMTRSELMAMMTGGMATISGGVMAAYASIGADPGHLLASSLMAAPGSLVIGKIMFPEVEESVTKGGVKLEVPSDDANILDAACRGAGEGLHLALNVGAMLIAFVSLAYLVNWGFDLLPNVAGAPLSLERILGWIFSPLAWLIGIEWNDIPQIAGLLGKKTVINEFVAYIDLAAMKDKISPRSFTIATYALCGFANLSSIAVQIGGIGSMVPERRKDFAQIGFKAMIAGTLSLLLNAGLAGLLL